MDVRPWDLGLDSGLGAVACDMSRLLAIVAIAMDSNTINLHGIRVMCGSRVWAWGWMMFRQLQSHEDWSGRAHGILALEHSSDIDGTGLP